MILNILFILVGVAAVLWGADKMTDGAVSVAQRMNIPEIVIGLTIVAMGTSAPELFVSMVSAIKGTPDLAVGNVVGSNIFNTLLIVGVAAMVAPMIIARSTVLKDMPITLLSSVLLLLFCMDSYISRLDALVLFAGFVAFMWYTVYLGKRGKAQVPENAAAPRPMWLSLLLIVIGLACLILGSNLFVEGATYIAASLGVSQAVIGLTVVAGGTSLPELATSVVAARKGQSAIAIGNVIGSNVMNILMIVGITGLISPMHIEGITTVDLSMLIISVSLLWFFSFTRFKVERWEGGLLTLIFLGYMTWLVSNAL